GAAHGDGLRARYARQAHQTGADGRSAAVPASRLSHLAAPRRGGHGDGETDLKGAHLTVAVAGNPNVGKTSLFNVLTGSRHEVGNYPGVTVERRVGHLASRFDGHAMQVVDLPGTYSLTATSEDEAVAFRALTG